MVPGPLCTPPEFILEVLKFTTNETRQGRAERMLVEEEAGLATEAALSASRAVSLLGEGAGEHPLGLMLVSFKARSRSLGMLGGTHS